MDCPLCSAYSKGASHLHGDGREYHACSECGLVWLSPAHRLSREAEELHYHTHENHGPSYLSYLSSTALPSMKKVPKGGRGLDFGCGPTEGMKELLNPLGYEVHSYDPIFFPISLTKNNYDFLLCSEAAEHFYRPAEEFALMNDCLKPGGWLIVRSALADGVDFENWYYRRDPTHVSFYRRQTVEWISKRWSWRLEELASPIWVLQKRG